MVSCETVFPYGPDGVEEFCMPFVVQMLSYFARDDLQELCIADTLH